MNNNRTTESAFLYLRVLIPLLLCIATVGTLLGFLRSEAPTNNSQRALTYAERVAYQRAIEEVYWRHRIWPTENPNPKPSLDAVMSQAQLEKRVTDYLRKSQALEDYWHRPITSEQLQGEMDRMAKHTKQPEVLCELFDALGNDPVIIAECLAKPILTERLIVELSNQHQTRRLESVRTAELRSLSITAILGQHAYTLPQIDSRTSGCTDDMWTSTTVTSAPAARILHTAVWTGSEMIIWGGCDDDFCDQLLLSGGKYNPSTDSWTATSTGDAPEAREGHTAVWTGSEMIVFGGILIQISAEEEIRTPAGDTIPALTLGRPRTPPTRLIRERGIVRFGPVVK